MTLRTNRPGLRPGAASSVATDDTEDEYEDVWPPPMPRSAVRYNQPLAPGVYTNGNQRVVMHPPIQAQQIPRRRSAPPQPPIRTTTTQPGHKTSTAPQQQARRPHFLVWVGLTMLAMLAGWVLVTSLLNWWSTSQDDLHYGRPRTYQTDMVVGHADSAAHPSHFIAINNYRHVEVIEFPGNDASKAKIYPVSTLIGDGQDLTVVTLTFKDVNGDGKIDMIVNVGGSHFIYINDQGQFRPARPGDNIDTTSINPGN